MQRVLLLTRGKVESFSSAPCLCERGDVPRAISQIDEKRLVLQHCTACSKLQYPPPQTCQVCGSAGQLEWKEVRGKGHIATYIVIEDGRLNQRMPDQPYNLALITLDEDPTVNFSRENVCLIEPYHA